MASPVIGALQGLVAKWEPTTPEGTAYEADLEQIISRFGAEDTEAPAPPGPGPEVSVDVGPPPPVDRNVYNSSATGEKFTTADINQGFKNKGKCSY